MIDQSTENMKRLGKYWGTTQLIGANCSEFGPGDKERRFNSAILIDKDRGYSARYDKMHCVPFGEYVPLIDYFPWLQKFTPYEGSYSLTPGDQLIHLPVNSPNCGTVYFGTLICYEDTVTQLARGYVAMNTPHVDFLVNISNDGWFKGTAEHEQHLAICQFRAVECRRAVVRAVNTGISAVIDANGRVTQLPGPTWSESKAIAAVMTATVPLDHRFSRYAMLGDWLPWSCWVIVLCMVLWPKWQR
jgi:apolipoprotein N-acyltransferase